MDTSKEYILQCEKAVEVQELWDKRAGDACSPKFSKQIIWIVGFNVGFSERKELTWLPRQDQLQAMLPDIFSNRIPTVLADKFNEFITKELGQNNMHSVEVVNWSMEQLWLAFVMSEKFNKTWSGSDWLSK